MNWGRRGNPAGQAGQANRTEPANRAGSGRVLGLICVGHFTSHLWSIVLPALFTVLEPVFHVDYVQLGLIITVTTITSAACQMPCGYLVDRYGPKRLLVLGLTVSSIAYLLMALAPNYATLMALGFVLGAGQTVFHPADYAILSALYPAERAGKPYSLHTFSGFTGSAVAPLAIAGLNAVFNWQIAIAAAGLLGLVIAAMMTIWLEVPFEVRATAARPATATATSQVPSRSQGKRRAGGFAIPNGLAFFLSGPLLLLFGFFAFTSMFSSGVQSYLPATISKIFDASNGTANAMLTVFMATIAAGVLAGGFLADRITNYARVIGITFSASTILMFLIAALPMPIWLLFVVFGASGVLQGVIMPSRDKMVRASASERDTGKSFAFVTLAMNVGSIIAVPVIGVLLDNSEARLVFWALAFCLLLASATVLLPSGRRAGRAEIADERVAA